MPAGRTAGDHLQRPLDKDIEHLASDIGILSPAAGRHVEGMIGILEQVQRCALPQALRDRNKLLLSGGYAPVYPEHELSAPPMAAVSAAIRQVLTAHLPFPALVVDGHWDMVEANSAIQLLIADVSPDLLEPPVNVLRLSLHPRGLAPRIVNLAQWRSHLLDRVDRQIDSSGDPELVELRRELGSYPGGSAGPESVPANSIIVPMRYRTDDGELNFFSTTTVFGTPRDITVAELAIESFYPADPETAAALRS